MTGTGMTIDQRFAEHMIAMRAERGWSVSELAWRAGLSAVTIDDIERGREQVTLADAYKVAVTLGVALAVMLDAEGLRAAP